MVHLDHDLRITLQPRSWHPRLRGLPEDRGGQAGEGFTRSLCEAYRYGPEQLYISVESEFPHCDSIKVSNASD